MSQSSTKPLPPGLHVILGDSAAGTFVSAFAARDRLLIDQDVLCCGPTAECADLPAWRRMRDDFWTRLVPGSEGEHVPSPINLIDHTHRLRDAERIHVWAAISLSEQLFIANVIRLAESAGADPSRISVFQFETLRNRNAPVLGMGELNEAQMSDHPEAVPLSPEGLADYRAAWRALSSADPTAFERFAGERPSANRWLRQAMQLMLRRFPDKQSGLAYWDRKLLSLTREHGTRAARIIGHGLAQQSDDADLTGDMYLFGRMLRLGDERLPQPLLKLTGDRTQMRNTEVMLTPFGEAVLDGKASNYPTNPIDDWAGGVKLSSAGAVWFNDGGKVVRG